MTGHAQLVYRDPSDDELLHSMMPTPTVRLWLDVDGNIVAIDLPFGYETLHVEAEL
jgi:hypothetical protein